MGKRLGTDLARPAALSAFAALLLLAAGKPVFTADYYVVDGGSGKVRSWVDWSDPAHVLDQSISARQSALPAAHADFAGQLCATFDATADSNAGTFYTSSRAAAAWLQHDGNGMECRATLTPLNAATTSVVLGTRNGTLTGFNLFWTGATSFGFAVANGTGVVLNAGGGTPTNGTPVYLRSSYVEGASPEYVLREKGTVRASGASVLAPAAGAATSTLILGRNAGANLPVSMRWRDTFFFPTQLTDPQRAVDESYELATNGIAA